MLASNEGALWSFDSSMLSVSFGALPGVEVLLCWLLMPWLKRCQGTGINFPVMLDAEELLGVPVVLERLEGTVSRPEVDVSEEPPADESERIANSMRPLCGSTVRSRR